MMILCICLRLNDTSSRHKRPQMWQKLYRKNNLILINQSPQLLPLGFIVKDMHYIKANELENVSFGKRRRVQMFGSIILNLSLDDLSCSSEMRNYVMSHTRVCMVCLKQGMNVCLCT